MMLLKSSCHKDDHRPLVLGSCKAPSSTNLLSADMSCSISGGDGNGKLITLSIFIVFICRSKSSTGFLCISGTVNSANWSLNTADEYSL